MLGVLALLDVGVTLVWQEPFSALYAKLQQDQLRGTLRTLEHAKPTARENARLLELVDERRRISFLASELARHASLGSAVGSIRIPRIGADFVLVYGTGTEELEQGPGIYTQSIYPGTRFPGLGGTTAIAGHRTTFLAPFRHIDELRRGDRILVNMPYAHFVYTVIDQRSVLPTDVYAAIRHARYSRLVLSACTPRSAPPNGYWCMRASPRPPRWGRRWRAAVSRGARHRLRCERHCLGCKPEGRRLLDPGSKRRLPCQRHCPRGQCHRLSRELDRSRETRADGSHPRFGQHRRFCGASDAGSCAPDAVVLGAAVGVMRRRPTTASAAAAATPTHPSANAAPGPWASISDPPSAEPPAMPATVAARCQVNASVTVPSGASAPTSENWQEIIGARQSPASTLRANTGASECTTISGATAIAIAIRIAL